MKRIITLSLLGIFSMGMSAQTTIADFESDIDTSVLTITGADETEQSVFELYAENPDKTGINDTDKCLYIKSNQDTDAGTPTWNGNVFTITFTEPIEITDDNRYLHFMHMKGATLNQWLVYASDGFGGTEVEIARGSILEANVWIDVVADFSGLIETVGEIKIVLDGSWGTTYGPTDFYYDEIVMNGDADGRGAAEVVYITDQNILDFEDEAVTNERALVSEQSTAYVTDIYAENPEKDGLNTTDRCASFCSPDATPTWWHGFYFTFKQPIETTGNQYLHLMFKKSIDESSNVVVNLVDAASAQSSNDLFFQPVASTWTDYVIEIPETHEIIYGMWVKFNTAQGTICYFDEMYMDSDPTPRTATTTEPDTDEEDGETDGIQETNVAKTIVCVDGKTITTADASQSMQVYNLLGGLVYEGEGSYEAKVAGIYIVTVNGTAQKVAVK